MKKLILVLFMLGTVIGFSQNADTSDYFRVGLYGGSLISPSYHIVEKNKYLNSVAIEAEYVKLKNLSFYVRGIYQFSRLNSDWFYSSTVIEMPQNYHIAVSFGSRYFLAEKNIRPYLQIGLNHETDYIGSFSYYYYSGNEINYYTYNQNWIYYYSLNFGIGLDIKINKKLSADIHYDLYRNFYEDYDSFKGFSVLAGLKYNIFY